VSFAGQFFNGARDLDQQIEQFQPVRVGYSGGNLGKQVVKIFFLKAIVDGYHKSLLKYSIDLLN